ncbi:hypothetical protein [Aestuariivivens insulae]|uniref:hypothetical protein n=1 Tax=Aestuariivivens insulae TaxID=1621988 RepID=UPI001F57E056|nr:hypothetical protein [Aestuariivivens insulae]
MKPIYFFLFILTFCCNKGKTIPEDYRNNWALYYIKIDESNILDNISNKGFITNLMVVNKFNKLYIDNHNKNIKISADITILEKNNDTVATITNSSDKRLNGVYEVNLKKVTNGKFHTLHLNLKSDRLELYAEKRTN